MAITSHDNKQYNYVVIILYDGRRIRFITPPRRPLLITIIRISIILMFMLHTLPHARITHRLVILFRRIIIIILLPSISFLLLPRIIIVISSHPLPWPHLHRAARHHHAP